MTLMNETSLKEKIAWLLYSLDCSSDDTTEDQMEFYSYIKEDYFSHAEEILDLIRDSMEEI